MEMAYLTSPLTNFNSKPFIASVPGSKSLTNRALVIAAQRMGKTWIRRALHSEDTDYLAACLDRLDGLTVEKTSDGYCVTRTRATLGPPSGELYVGGAGTPARFLLSFAAMVEGETVIAGSPRLSERPMGDLLRSFDRLGVQYECLRNPDCLPIRVRRSIIPTRDWSVSGAISSQFTSSLLLLAAQQQSGPIILTVADRLVSRSYVDMTVRMLGDCGISATRSGTQTFVVEPGSSRNDVIDIEADASGMSYFLAAAALTGSHVVIPNIGHGSAQGDVGFAAVLRDMGCKVKFNADSIELQGADLHGVDVDMEDMPDTVLTLAAVAAAAEGSTRISNVANLRVKECDRIHAAVAELQRLGVPAEEGPDWLTVRPNGAVKPGRVVTYDDHRVAMAFALLGLLHPGIEIENPQCVGKSFPTFWTEYERFRQHHLGAIPNARSQVSMDTRAAS
jgi:3-phosphoshikimate 1-carboxyvinyltransferase